MGGEPSSGLESTTLFLELSVVFQWDLEAVQVGVNATAIPFT